MFRIKYQRDAVDELTALHAFIRVRILDAVADYRVFYDVDEDERLVIVRHVRRKGQRTTGEIL